MSEIKETLVTPETSSPIVGEQSSKVQEQPEQPEQEAKPEVDKEDEFTKRFATLSKREKQLREERKKIKDYEDKIKQYESLKEQGVGAVLESFGLTMDDVINHALGSDAESLKEPVDPNQQLREEFEAYKKQVEDEKQAKLDAQKEAEEARINKAITDHKDGIAKHISNNPDKYELIASQNQQELVWSVTEAEYEKSGKILSIEEASDKVEAYLEEEVRKLLKLKKFGNLTQKQEEQLNEIQANQSKTLTSSHTVSTPVREKAMTHEESLKKAAELLKWK